MTFQRLALFVAASAFGTCIGFSRTASACTVAPQFTDYVVQADSSDRVAPTLLSASIDVRRAENPESGGADCSNLGSFRVRVDASDDRTSKADLGFDVSLVDGTLPFTFPSQYFQSFEEPSEDFSTWFSDDGGEFAGTVSVRVVDRAGNVSEPVTVHVTSEEPGCGCSMVGSKRFGAAGWLGAFLLLALARRASRQPGGRRLRFIDHAGSSRDVLSTVVLRWRQLVRPNESR